MSQLASQAVSLLVACLSILSLTRAFLFASLSSMSDPSVRVLSNTGGNSAADFALASDLVRNSAIGSGASHFVCILSYGVDGSLSGEQIERFLALLSASAAGQPNAGGEGPPYYPPVTFVQDAAQSHLFYTQSSESEDHRLRSFTKWMEEATAAMDEENAWEEGTTADHFTYLPLSVEWRLGQLAVAATRSE